MFCEKCHKSIFCSVLLFEIQRLPHFYKTIGAVYVIRWLSIVLNTQTASRSPKIKKK